jgi:hypothetical protein
MRFGERVRLPRVLNRGSGIITEPRVQALSNKWVDSRTVRRNVGEEGSETPNVAARFLPRHLHNRIPLIFRDRAHA